MYFSRGICKLGNIASASQRKTLIENSILHRFFSDNVPSTETATLDKLYKKLEVEVRGNDPAVLKSYGIFTTTAASHLGITVTKNSTSKKHSVERFTVLKSAFVHKKHRVQYEIRTYYRFLEFARITGSTADTLLEYLQRNLPEGVAMKVTRHEIMKLPDAFKESPQPTV